MSESKSTALVLRACTSEMTSRGGFVWPGVGGVATAPDWRDDSECGHGLHGWLYGQGDHTVSNLTGDPTAKWLVVEVEESTIRMLGGKCKFPSGKVVFVGARSEAAAYIVANEPRAQSVAVIGLVREVGDNGVAEGGAYATLTGGDGATLTGGDGATLTGGYGATLTGGNGATLTGGDGATLTGGDGATLTGGDGATLTGGDGAELRFQRWDSKAERYRTVLAYVGEDGIEANTAYRLDDSGKVTKVEQA